MARVRERKKQRFVVNAAILTATSLLLRAVGMYFRIYISALIGAEGIGLYQLIMSVYVLASGFASSGIVVAVTRMTADEMVCGSRESVRMVLRRCLTVSIAMGAISAVLIACLAEPIGAGWISDPRAVMSVRAMSLALPFMSVSCCLRGYFTARRRVTAPSIAQMTEQAVRIVLAIVLLGKMMPLGTAYACLAIMISDVISEAAGCLYVVIAYLVDRRRLVCPNEKAKAPSYDVGRRIWDIAAPITASHYLTTLLRTVESILVPDCLTIFEQSRTRALELFGLVKGMALPLILFPSTLLTAFSSLLIPEISEAVTLGQRGRIERAVKRTMHITLALSVPIGGVFLLYPYELGMMIYHNAELAPILRLLAPFMPLMYAESVVVGILRGLGEQKSSLRYGILDSVVRIILIIAAVPRYGLGGFLAVMVVSNLLTPLLHILRLMKVTDIVFDFSKWAIKPLAACIGGYAAAYFIGDMAIVSALPMLVRVAVGGSVCMMVYAALLYVIGGVRREDIVLR
ncbi:MAG: polysaccharide biosynthesis protein [Clostridia bacterium]|nr:polysaccharide biosynthesis protein [Clostridia bacterium]